VLLKNQKRSLPLSGKLRHLVVAGKAADDLGIQCGGWTISWQGKTGPVIHGGTTILSAVKHTAKANLEVTYSPDGSQLAGADAVLLVIGEQPYAEMKGDRSDLRLGPEDIALVEKAKRSGAPVITVLLSGRPLVLGPALDASDALIAAWLPGTEGQGVADVLFGAFRPKGKLSRTWPHTNDQLGLTYADPAAGNAQFRCGFGLTY
jgi:beta-glucosidase